MRSTNALQKASATRDVRLGVMTGSMLLAMSLAMPAHAATDIGKKACAKEARVLCPAEMKTMSRKKVEACMIAKVERTSPTCKAAMYRIKAEREQGSKN